LGKLVIYYSLEGNTKFIAKIIADTIEAELLELKLKKDIPQRGFMKYLLGGLQVFTKRKPELHPLDKDPKNFDILFIGSPVWAGSFTPAFATFFSSQEIKDKKIALFCCHAGSKGKIFEKIKENLKGNKIVGEIDFIEPLKKAK